MRCKIINKRCLHGSAYLSKFQNCFSIIKMASLTHALIGSGSKRSSPDSRESRLRLVRRECKPLSVTVRASNRSASDRKASVASIETKGKKFFSFFSPPLTQVFRNFSKFPRVFLALSRTVGRKTKRNETVHALSILSLFLSLSLVAFANSARKEPRDLLCGGSIENTCNFAAFRIAVSQSIRPLRLICPVTRLVGCAKFIIPATMEKLRRE